MHKLIITYLYPHFVDEFINNNITAEMEFVRPFSNIVPKDGFPCKFTQAKYENPPVPLDNIPLLFMLLT